MANIMETSTIGEDMNITTMTIDSIAEVNEVEVKEIKQKETKSAKAMKSDDDFDQDDNDDLDNDKVVDRFGGDDDSLNIDPSQLLSPLSEEDEDFNFDAVENILVLPDHEFPKFTLAKNKARFLRMVSWYRQKEEWIEVAPLSGVQKLFKQQSKELEGIRANKMDYEMELETGTLTPSQRSYKKDELKMCRVQEKMAVHLIAKLQLKIKSGRR